MESHINNLLSEGANLNDVYEIYKALQTSGFIDTKKIVRNSSDRDIFYHLIDKVKDYQHKDSFIPFIQSYLADKDNSVFEQNKYGYRPLEKISHTFKGIAQDTLIKIYDIIFKKISINEFIGNIAPLYGYYSEMSAQEQKIMKISQVVNSAYEEKYFDLLDFFKLKGIDVSADSSLRAILRSVNADENCFKYYMDNHTDLKRNVEFDGKILPVWQHLMANASLIILPLVEKWCAENIDQNVLEKEKVTKIKDSLKVCHSKTCEKLKTIDSWEGLYDEEGISVVRYAINKDAAHANKITLKRSIESLSKKDIRGENVWVDVLANCDTIHVDAVSFIKDNVELSLNNKNQGIFEQLLEANNNERLSFPVLNNYKKQENQPKVLKIIGKVNPNLILGSRDFLKQLTEGKDYSFYNNEFAKLIYKYIKAIPKSRYDSIEDKEWFGFALLMHLMHKRSSEEDANFVETLLENGALLPKHIQPEIIEDIFSGEDGPEILKKLKVNFATVEREILLNDLKDENVVANISRQKRI